MVDMMRVRVTQTGYTGGPGLMTFYFQSAATPGTAEATEVCQRVQAFCTTASSAWFTAVSSQVSGQVDLLDPGTGILTGSIIVTSPTAVAGSGGANNTAISTAALLTHNTSTVVGGRRLKGRTFISPLSTSALTAAGLITSTLVTALGNAGGKLGTVILTSGVNPVVWHRPKSGSGGLAVSTAGWSASNKPAVLRSRRD